MTYLYVFQSQYIILRELFPVIVFALILLVLFVVFFECCFMALYVDLSLSQSDVALLIVLRCLLVKCVQYGEVHCLFACASFSIVAQSCLWWISFWLSNYKNKDNNNNNNNKVS